MMVDFDWFNTFYALIVPGLGGVFGMFIMRQFFLNIPKELISAQMDGLGKFRTFIHIVVPLSTSAFMVAGLFSFLGSWNDYMWPSIIMAGVDDRLTLPVGLATLQGAILLWIIDGSIHYFNHSSLNRLFYTREDY